MCYYNLGIELECLGKRSECIEAYRMAYSVIRQKFDYYDELVELYRKAYECVKEVFECN